jgi:phospholipid/cholesterol/gamma-HCH transport system substrate-binding protein
MKITGTAIKLGAFALVLFLFSAIIIVVFGQMRFDRTTGYSAIFTNASGLKSGQFVRASGVEVGKVEGVSLIDGGKRVRVEFNVDRSLPLYQGTTASIRYLNLIGERYLELTKGDNDQRLQTGGTIPVERTHPALDLDALVGSFKPLFRALDATKVNTISKAIITVFQGQGGTINDILNQTAELTSTLAERDQAIGEVIKNLNTVLDTTVRHQAELDKTIQDFESLITGLNNRADPIADSTASISNATGTIGDILADNRPLLHDTLGQLETIQQPLVDQKDDLNAYLTNFPHALRLFGRAGGIYGDFFNFYACDVTLQLFGLQPGGPVRTVKILWDQPSGRCTPQ